MLKKIKKRINNFFISDLRWKLIKLTKYSRISFYPKFFARKGIKGFYSKIIIHLFLNKQIKKIKKDIIDDFFEYDNNDVNFLISSPSSGGTFCRNMLRSYFELFYEFGDGVPKYDSVNESLFFAGYQIHEADMWSQIDIKKYLIDKNKIIDKETYKKKKIVFSRYPLNNIDLYKPEQGRPVVLIRDPFDEISSSYFKYDRRPKEIKLKEINHKLLKSKIRAYEIYIKYWSDFASDPLNKNRFLFVNFKDLVENSETYLEKILKFYEYEINKEYIKKSVTVHSKENTKKNLLMIKEFNIKQRFADPEEKKILQKLIKDYFDKLLSETSIMKKYNYIKSIK